MIAWLRWLFGLEPKVAPERRRSLIARLQDADESESSTMLQAQRAIERHERRERAIADQKAKVAEHKSRCKEQRQEHQSEISESTVSLEKVRRDTTRKRRRMQLIDVSEAARREARRRREHRG